MIVNNFSHCDCESKNTHGAMLSILVRSKSIKIIELDILLRIVCIFDK